MKIGKFIVLAVSAGLIALGVSQLEKNPIEEKLAIENAPHFITHAEATALWNKIIDKNEQLAIQENNQPKIVLAGFDPKLESIVNDKSHYITKDEAEKFLNESIAKTKVIAKEVHVKINEALETTNKGIDKLLTGNLEENTNEVKKILKAQFSSVNTNNIIKAKDKTIDAIVDTLEKMRSEPRQNNKENKPK